MQVRILEPIDPYDASWMKQIPAEVNFRDTRSDQDDALIPFIKEADALVVGGRPISHKVIETCPRLKFIVVCFSGLDHIPLDLCKERGIVVRNTRGYATHAVAELALFLALRLQRMIGESELFGKVVGIVGGGAIGLETARLFSALGSRTLLYHYRPLEGVSQVPINQLLAESDLISLHLPYKPETHHFIDHEKLSLMKPGAFLINLARAGIVDQKALIAALEQKILAGVALDVYEEDPKLNRGNVILTSHLGFQTREAYARRTAMALEYLKQFIAHP